MKRDRHKEVAKKNKHRQDKYGHNCGPELTLLLECLRELNNASVSARADISLSMSVNRKNDREKVRLVMDG